MSQTNSFSIESIIKFRFKTTKIRDISYKSFLPEFTKLQTKRSEVFMEKRNNNLIVFNIKSKDITAFRASINEIISFGKIIDNTSTIVDIS